MSVKKSLIFLFLMFGAVIGLTNNVKAETYDSDYTNLASPDLTDKEYLGDGEYLILSHDTAQPFTLTYNVYSGIYTFNGLPRNIGSYKLGDLNASLGDNITMSFIYGSGSSGTLGRPFFSLGLTAKSVREDATNATYVIESNDNQFSTYFGDNISYNNYKVKLQIEKGTTITPYEVPIGALEQHIQFEKELSYDEGYNDGRNEYGYFDDDLEQWFGYYDGRNEYGYFDDDLEQWFGYYDGLNEGYVDGFDDGLNEAFNANNLMPTAEKRGKGTTGPSNEYIGFRVPINKKVNYITLLNLGGYNTLKPLEWTSGTAGNIKQGFIIQYETRTIYIPFENEYDEFHDFMEFKLNIDEVVENITVILALNNPAMPAPDLENMLEHMVNNMGFYINNKLLNDHAVDRFKEIIEFELDIEYKNELDSLLSYYLDIEYQKGYDKGFNENIETGGFGMLLASAFSAVGVLLSIQLLPNISIGALVAIPVVFGVVMFIIGRRKE